MKRLFMPISIIAGIANLLSFCSTALAQPDEEKNFLLLYFTEDELVVQSATRSLKPLSRTAENVTVVTAVDIELMNAHSVAEVLNTVTGVQVAMTGGPGQIAVANIQGSDARHVTVIIDGVILNDIGDNTADVGMLPVQNIEKIEIIKGPASSAWGSALGGVVNIITKSGARDNQGGVLSASYGTKNSGDFRAEARGKLGNFGYYLTAGRLQSDGLTPGFDVEEYDAYTKLTYDITDNAGVLFTLGYVKNSRGQGLDELNDLSFGNRWEILHTTLAVNSRLSSNLELNISVREIEQTIGNESNQLSTGMSLGEDVFSDKGYGSSAKLIWKADSQSIVLGADYDGKTLTSANIVDGEKGITKWAVYANDAISLDKLAITPGVRYDHTSTNGSITSPSLGIAYNLSTDTTLRLYGAKGFNIPPLAYTYVSIAGLDPNPDLKMETVRSYQAGVETAALKYLWLKVSVFWNEIRDAIAQGQSTVDPANSMYVNEKRQRRRGVDYQVKTAPVYNTSVSAGAEFIDATDLDTGQRLQNVPIRVYDIGIHYDDLRSFRAMLVGRYINWNSEPDWNGTYGSYVYDLHLIKKLYQHKNSFLEAFVDAHNLFNRNQYFRDIFKNPERWYEGGVRLNF